MNEPVSAYELSCPYCGARNARGEAKCWLCKQPLAVEAGGNEPILAEAVDVRPQFALSSLLLVITLACISAGLVAAAPGFIIPLVIVVVPALIRSVAASRAAGGQVSIGQKLVTFFVSLWLVVAIWVAGIIALCAACTLIVIGGAAMEFNDQAVNMLAVISIGVILAALVLVGWLYYLIWPGKKKRIGP